MERDLSFTTHVIIQDVTSLESVLFVLGVTAPSCNPSPLKAEAGG